MKEFGKEVRMRTVKKCADAFQGLTVFRRQLGLDTRGQGTVEYAILVGVLVIIAIIAVIAFRDNLQSLWENIAESINSL